MQQMNKTVYFSIGGMAYANNWKWLNEANMAAKAGKICTQVSKKFNVGIEIDYEGFQNPLNGITTFIKAFRMICSTCLLSMDLYGSPGAQDWQKELVSHLLPPNGYPGDKYGDGNHLDFVNIMVIDGQSIKSAEIYWQQWVDTKVLTLSRSTFGLIAGWPGSELGVCQNEQYAKQNVDEAVRFLKPLGIYGLMSWAICPPAQGSIQTCGDWMPECNHDASGFHYMCNSIDAC
jgi:hypothetical protein